jgi:hypothetical protein
MALVAFIECRFLEKQMQVIQISVDEVLSVLLHLVEQLSISTGWAAQDGGWVLARFNHSFNNDSSFL